MIAAGTEVRYIGSHTHRHGPATVLGSEPEFLPSNNPNASKDGRRYRLRLHNGDVIATAVRRQSFIVPTEDDESHRRAIIRAMMSEIPTPAPGDLTPLVYPDKREAQEVQALAVYLGRINDGDCEGR